MYVRIHTRGEERLVAACDEDIVGMTFREGEARLTVHEAFYVGESLDEEAFVERLRMATVINLTGDGVVTVAVREGLVSPDAVMVIGGVKHAQAVRL